MADLGEQEPYRVALRVRPERLAICQLEPDSPPPWRHLGHGFWAVAHTEEELSLVLPEGCVQPGWRAERGWRCLEVVGPLGLDLTGVLAQISAPLADTGIPVFVLSTYNTDEILVREADLERTVAALTARGHQVEHNRDQRR